MVQSEIALPNQCFSQRLVGVDTAEQRPCKQPGHQRRVSPGLTDAKGRREDQPPHARLTHRPQDHRHGSLHEIFRFERQPAAKSADHGVLAAHRFRQRRLVLRQRASHDTRAGLFLGGQLAAIANEHGDVVTQGLRFLQRAPACTAGGAQDQQLHFAVVCARTCAESRRQVRMQNVDAQACLLRMARGPDGRSRHGGHAPRPVAGPGPRSLSRSSPTLRMPAWIACATRKSTSGRRSPAHWARWASEN